MRAPRGNRGKWMRLGLLSILALGVASSRCDRGEPERAATESESQPCGLVGVEVVATQSFPGVTPDSLCAIAKLAIGSVSLLRPYELDSVPVATAEVGRIQILRRDVTQRPSGKVSASWQVHLELPSRRFDAQVLIDRGSGTIYGPYWTHKPWPTP